MNPATRRTEANATAPVLYMGLELSDLEACVRRRRHAPAGTVLAADLLKLAEVVVKAKERFGMPNLARVVNCYAAGRDGFWLKSVGAGSIKCP